MIFQSEPHDSVLAETYMNANNCFFLNVDICLKDYSSPLNIENKDLAQFFALFHLISFKAPRGKVKERKKKYCETAF